jgi:poly(3-hydroxybutyrate) depolymerase
MKVLIACALFASLSLPFFVRAQDQTPAIGQWSREKSKELDYWIYRPASANANHPRSALMLSLHGCAQTADDFKNFANWEQAAETNRMTVVLPFVPNGGVYFGCWDYYGRDHTLSNKANGALLALTQSLLLQPALDLDPQQVFVSGLSSGSAQAMILGCLRPDLFRGVGLAAGPVLGSGVTDLYVAPRITSAEVAQVCLDLAGPRAPALAHQITSIIFDERDPAVSPMHSALALEAMRIVYEKTHGPLQPTTLDLSTLSGLNTSGNGTLLLDSHARVRLSYIMNAGLGHAWPAGGEPSKTGAVRSPWGPSSNRYINPKSVNYPAYLGELFGELSN